MKIDLNSFERQHRVEVSIPQEQVDLDEEHARVADNVGISATLERSAAAISLLGRLSGIVEIDCDRCLEPVETPFDIELDLEFASPETFGGSSVELGSEDMKLDALNGSEIDLADIAREQILLGIPQQFFCTEECKGLCPQCGTNRNLKDCECSDNEIDPRWAALKDLS